MKPKEIIAVDIDDVIAEHASAFVAYANKKYGLNRTIDDYQDSWNDVWGTDYDETQKRALEYHESGYISTYEVIKGALEVLQEIKKQYELVVITTRRASINKLTQDWISEHYPDVFDRVVFAGFFDTPTRQSINMTKGELAKGVQADYLIDDQLKHCTAAAGLGIKALLFGDYPWNQSDKLPPGVTRVKNWQEVLEYFDEQG